jgi:dihydroorotase
MNDETLILNARLVNEGRITEGDLLIRKGRIAKIAPAITDAGNAAVIDARGRYLLPGMIDDQVHFREPGLTHKGGIRSESRAAAAGGITSFMEMPNTLPPTVTLDALEDKYVVAAEKSLVNYAFYLGATNDNLDVIRALQPGQAAGIKIFMGASTGNMLVDNQETLAGIFRDAPALIATHCESSPLIDANLAAALEKYGPEIPVTEHPNIRSTEACYVSTVLAQELARRYSAPLHVLHLSTGREMELFEPGPMNDKLITAEVCVHFLHFDASHYPTHGNRIKCNPAIKTPADRAALLQAIKDGRLDIIATDHAPHTAEEKAATDYRKAPSGLPLVQDALLSVLELHHDGEIGLEQIVRLTAHNVADRFRVVDRGYLREGYWADLVLVDTATPTRATADRVLSQCGWTPFEGETFRSSIARTIVNGQTVYDGQSIVEAGTSMRLEIGAQR